MIGATIWAVILAVAKKWRWVPMPFIALIIIWALGYWLATSSSN
jgi:hypothetical protein